jgi:hypothetical protein
MPTATVMTSTSDMTQLSIDLGKRLKQSGQSATLQAEADEWKRNAMLALRVYAAKHRRFTCESFRYDYLSAGGPQPHVHKVWGAMFTAAARAGYIEHTGEYRKAASPETHGHPVAVWKRGEKT